MRLRSTLAVALTLLPLAAAQVPFCPSTSALNTDAQHFLLLINQTRANPRYRAETGGAAAPLRWNAAAAALAQCHADQMSRDHSLSHADALGPNPGARYDQAGIAWARAGENVGMAISVIAIHQMFMDEPPNQPNHRGNILDRHFTEVGIGVAQSKDGLLWVAEDFLTPPAPSQLDRDPEAHAQLPLPGARDLQPTPIRLRLDPAPLAG